VGLACVRDAHCYRSPRLARGILRLMAREALFVYGSLKRGGRHHDELRDATFVGQAWTESGYAIAAGPGEYLAMVRVSRGGSTHHETPEPARVQGELFEIDASLIPALDAFEGEEYRREVVRVSCGEALALGGDEPWRPALAYLGKPR
jgi:gamma-glutamylcyclotransferase (GGCT)/AIG2-like uncharacterized protein YtfP